MSQCLTSFAFVIFSIIEFVVSQAANKTSRLQLAGHLN